MRVILCKDLAELGAGFSLKALRRWLAETHAADVHLSADGCARPEIWLEGVGKAESGAVLAFCHAPPSRIELLAQARKAGIPRGAVGWVQLGHVFKTCSGKNGVTERAKTILGGAIARVRAGGGGGPQNDKMLMSWDQQVSRRSLFRLPPVRYEIIPSINADRCAAGDGCRICADLCPHDALKVHPGGRMEVQKNPCTGCGACVPACPREAFTYPGNSMAEVEAQVRALLGQVSDDGENKKLLFHCHNSAGRLDETGMVAQGWLPVELPCLGMVTPAWMLQSLNLGAGAVAMLPCPPAECRFGERDILSGRVAYCRQVLQSMGMNEDCVQVLTEDRFCEADVLQTHDQEVSGEDFERMSFSPGAAANAILSLSEKSRNNPPSFALLHEHSPLGVVRLSEGCTLCGSCAAACPAGALFLEGEGNVSLVFHPQACVGCRGCVPVCPEDVVEVQKMTDTSLLAGGKRELFQDTAPRCVKCGAPVAPQAMLNRIRSVITDDAAFKVMSQHCLDCRKTLF